jgi:hypothetical protein
MIGLLSAIGRAIVVTAAVLTVIGFSIGGFLTARTQEAVLYGGSFAISGGGRTTPFELFCLVIGCGIGFLVAGTVFGAIATLYDIRDSLRQLIELSSNASVPPSARVGGRREPRMG